MHSDCGTDLAPARWLEQTICLRARQMMLAAGVNADIRPMGLYDLLLMSLNAAGKRAKGAERA